MSDPIRVRFPCHHGIWFRHMVKPVGVKPDWCEGGHTKLLRKASLDPAEWLYDAKTEQNISEVWVEVEE